MNITNYNFNWNHARRLAPNDRRLTKELSSVLAYETSKQTYLIFGLALWIIPLVGLTSIISVMYGDYGAIPGVFTGLVFMATLYTSIKTISIRSKIRKDQEDPNHPWLKSLLPPLYVAPKAAQVQMTELNKPLSPILE